MEGEETPCPTLISVWPSDNTSSGETAASIDGTFLGLQALALDKFLMSSLRQREVPSFGAVVSLLAAWSDRASSLLPQLSDHTANREVKKMALFSASKKSGIYRIGCLLASCVVGLPWIEMSMCRMCQILTTRCGSSFSVPYFVQ